MTDKELHKLSRSELLEIMVEQQKEIERLQTELDQAKSLIESRKMLMRKAGSIAEASLRISEVFEAAQKAADRYVMSVKASCEHGILETDEEPAETETAEPIENEAAETAPSEDVNGEEAGTDAPEAEQSEAPAEEQAEAPAEDSEESPAAEY